MSEDTVQRSKRSINLNFDTEYLDKDLDQRFKKHLKCIPKFVNELKFNPLYIDFLKRNCYSEEFFNPLPKEFFKQQQPIFYQSLKTKFIHNIFQIFIQVEIKGKPGLKKKIFNGNLISKQIPIENLSEIPIHKIKSEFYDLDNLKKIFPLGMEISFDKEFINYGDKRIYIIEINYFINGDQYTLNNLNKYKIIINSFTTVINQNSEYLEIGFTDAILDIPPNILQNIKNDHEYYTGVIIKFENYYRNDKNNFILLWK